MQTGVLRQRQELDSALCGLSLQYLGTRATVLAMTTGMLALAIFSTPPKLLRHVALAVEE